MYTLVQHCGYTVGGNPQFKQAVETHRVDEAEANYIVKNGGIVFDTYNEASDAEYLVNYPHKEYTGLIPSVTGTFKIMKKINYPYPVYLPSLTDRENINRPSRVS